MIRFVLPEKEEEPSCWAVALALAEEAEWRVAHEEEAFRALAAGELDDV